MQSKGLPTSYHGPPLVVVLLDAPAFSQPKALPEPIGFVFVGAGPDCDVPRSLFSCCAWLISGPLEDTGVEGLEAVLVTFDIDLPGRRTFIGLGALCREKLEEPGASIGF